MVLVKLVMLAFVITQIQRKKILERKLMIKVYDNLLPEHFADSIEQLHTSPRINWYLHQSTVDKEYHDDKRVVFTTDNVVNSPQFVHVFYSSQSGHSQLIPEVESVMKHLDVNFNELNIRRIKSNLTTYQKGYKENNTQPPHVDSIYETDSSLIYYVNDSDGDTLFYDDDMNIIKRVSPKKNRAVLFPSTMVHAGCNPIKNDTRLVINYIFNTEKIIDSADFYKLGDADKAIFEQMDKMLKLQIGELA